MAGMDDPILKQVIQAIETAKDDGCPIGYETEAVAKIALRRYRSQGRRRVKDNRPAKMQDLSKGIIEHFDDRRLVGPGKTDYLYIAGAIIDVLESLPPDPTPHG
jgi:hypothetical protein